MINVLQDMLLIEDPSVFRLYQELIKIANYFVAPVFTIALLFEYFGDMNFSAVVKKLFLVIVFMGAFYTFHTEGTKVALDSANQTLRRVSPTNLFVKRWTQAKVKTKKKKGWDSLKSILIPNLNDLIGTAFFLLAKLFIWLLKLIYSSVYHLTYIFAGVTAILYFLGWTKDALKGTVQASLWCMVMPFVIVAILSLVGNSIEATALNGDLVIAKIDTIIWLFGVTLLLLISPLITYGMIRGDGIHSFGSKMGAMVVSSGIKAMTFYPMMAKMMSIAKNRTLSPFRTLNPNQQKNFNGSKSNSKNNYNKNAKFQNRKSGEKSSVTNVAKMNSTGRVNEKSNTSKVTNAGKAPVVRSKTQPQSKIKEVKSSSIRDRNNKTLNTKELLRLKTQNPKEFKKQVEKKQLERKQAKLERWNTRAQKWNKEKK